MDEGREFESFEVVAALPGDVNEVTRVTVLDDEDYDLVLSIERDTGVRISQMASYLSWQDWDTMVAQVAAMREQVHR